MSEVRSETGRALPSAARLLIAAGRAAPSADNTQPWRFHWDHGTLALEYHPEPGAIELFGTDGHCEHLTMGAVAENLIQVARAAGLAVDWHLESAGPTYLRGRLDAQAPISDAGYRHPLFTRHTNRLKYRRTPIAAEVLGELAGLAEGDCRLLLLTDRRQIAETAALVELAARLRFRTRAVHEWFGRVLRFTPAEVATGTGLDVATIDLPPGGRWLLRLIQDWNRLARLNRIGMYRLLARIESAKIEDAAAVIAVVGPRGNAAEVAAGRLLERAWILLNARGIAVQPFYVVTDLLARLATRRLPAELESEARTLDTRLTAFLPAGLALHMLLRAGPPLRDPVRSRRLPLDAAYTMTLP